MLAKVIQVFATEDFKVYVYFHDGKVKLYDMSDKIHEGVFSQISHIEDFIGKCTVMNGTLAWDIHGNFNERDCLDIDPEVIYKEGVEVCDPLEKKT